MSNKNNEDLNNNIEFSTDVVIKKLQDQLSQNKLMLEQQKQQNKELREKMILQDKLNNQLSNFHLTSYFQDKETKNLSTKKDEELSKAQEHIIILGHMLIKNKKTIERLKKSKSKDTSLCNQIAELINEKEYLWDVILKTHTHLTQTPFNSEEPREQKIKEIMDFLENKNKKLKP